MTDKDKAFLEEQRRHDLLLALRDKSRSVMAQDGDLEKILGYDPSLLKNEETVELEIALDILLHWENDK